MLCYVMQCWSRVRMYAIYVYVYVCVINQAGIEISLWHLNQSATHVFDPAKFYTKILVA